MPIQARLGLDFDAVLMQRDLAAIPDADWIDHFVSQNYEGCWRVLPLRGPRTAEHPVMMIHPDPACSDFSDTPWLGRCPYLQEVLASFATELQAVRLMKLGPGSKIKEHRDHDLALENGIARLHVPISSNPDVDFFLAGDPVELQVGECWYLRLCEPHRLENRGTTDRVHLVLDVVVNDWLRAQLQESPDESSR